MKCNKDIAFILTFLISLTLLRILQLAIYGHFKACFTLVFGLLLHTLLEVQGVCIGLSEVMASAGKNQILTFMDDLIPSIRAALCDRYAVILFNL